MWYVCHVFLFMIQRQESKYEGFFKIKTKNGKNKMYRLKLK